MELTHRCIRLTFPGLTRFFSTYFHQDWKTGANNAADVLARFFAESYATSANLQRCATEIRQLIDEYGDDAGIEAALAALGCHDHPSADGRPARAWLADLHDRMLREAEAAERQPYRDLAAFLAASFPPDQNADTEGAVARFVAGGATLRQLLAIATQMCQLIAARGDDAGIEAALDALGCSCRPSADGRPARVWLADLCDRMLQAAEAIQQRYIAQADAFGESVRRLG